MSAVRINHLERDAQLLLERFNPPGLAAFAAKGSMAALLALRLAAKGARGAAEAVRAQAWLDLLKKETPCR